jgi:uncharacterized protein (TIGR03083 family)
MDGEVGMTPDEYVGRFAAEAARLRELLSSGDLGAPVPGCPGWDLADLGGHVGGVYRFAATAIVENRGAEPPAGPRERGELLGWFDAGYGRIHDALAAGDWEQPCWTMAPPGNIRFWARRMCHETWLHAWDAQRSQGGGGALDAEPAADGVDEVVRMFFPRQVRLGRVPPLRDALEVRVDDVPTDRLVLYGDGSDPRHAEDAVLSGRAAHLLLLLWKRATLADHPFTVTGDEAAARRVLATALTP